MTSSLCRDRFTIIRGRIADVDELDDSIETWADQLAFLESALGR